VLVVYIVQRLRRIARIGENEAGLPEKHHKWENNLYSIV
jgi:hypothetical protein